MGAQLREILRMLKEKATPPRQLVRQHGYFEEGLFYTTGTERVVDTNGRDSPTKRRFDSNVSDKFDGVTQPSPEKKKKLEFLVGTSKTTDKATVIDISDE